MATFTSKVNGNDIYAKRAEATRSGVNLETFTKDGVTTQGILPAGIATPESATDDVNILATRKYVQDQVGEVAEAMLYKGAVSQASDLPTADYKAGWTYKVAEAGTYAGQVCEVGDLIIANKDYVSGTASNADWDVIQTNIDGAVVGPASAVGNNIAAFDGTTGKLIKDGGIAIDNIKTKQAAVSVTGGTLKGVASFSQNANGEATLVLNDIQDGTTSQKGVVQLQDTIGASEVEDGKAATPKAVRDAINALDVDELTLDTNQTITSIQEVNGKIRALKSDIQIEQSQVTGLVTVLTEIDNDKADKVADAVNGNFAALDGTGNLKDSGHKHSDYKTKQTAYTASGLGTLKTITALTQDANGEISATASDIQSATTAQAGVVQLAGSVGATVASENNKAASEKAVRDAINDLDATNVTGASNGITVKVSEADGVITSVVVEASAATAGGDPGLVSYGTIDL